MYNHLAKVLTDQMAQGNKCDGDTWKPQALQAVVTYLNSNVVSDVQTKQSGFTWDEERKMTVDDIVLLCGKDRATAKGEEEEIEVNSAPILGPRTRPSSSTDSMHDNRKRPKKDSLGKLSVKKKFQEKPSGIEIYEVVFMVPGLTSNEVFKVVRKLMNGDVEEFNLLRALRDKKKKECIYFLIDS
ncbi:hypothetical protein Pfo_008026 [Paulownia fortunei]|nr:hypothetical protein Pfo_008026 [Paulownia fortunei]